MGSLSNGYCYETSAEAVDNYYSSTSPSLVSGSTSYLTEFHKTGTVWNIHTYQISGSGAVSTRYDVAAPIPTLPTCDPYQNLYDGLVLSWLIVFVWAGVWGIKVMRKALTE